jgi:hypothetical protein
MATGAPISDNWLPLTNTDELVQANKVKLCTATKASCVG